MFLIRALVRHVLTDTSVIIQRIQSRAEQGILLCWLIECLYCLWGFCNLVPRVSLLPVPWSAERERERHHGMVWSHESEKTEDVREGSLYFNFVVICFVTIIERLSCSIRMWSAIASRDVFTAAFTLQFRLAATTTSM